ncbi:S-layer homology domain-containing protein [Paenibacillus sp. PR3]|uniref:S-layer homology domain-containing protein n=1 Tax=Paenibacillus terricola TaxID=2763503 RepID=A0ABR8N0R7_9BACL|nr:invasin domain 3-containing protein [Paenibacillus terricola]MBD3920384.1 S-layer homology domain-containing protein [Paenibacillus terricola]
MKRFKSLHQWLAVILVITLSIGAPSGEFVHAAGAEILDQAQPTSGGSNVWANATYQRYQSFTPAISGNLSRIELNIAGFLNPGFLQAAVYKETDLSTPLATAQLTGFGEGWVSLDFTGTMPYLKRETMYRMVVSTQNGGSSGIGWYSNNSNPYPRGRSDVALMDFLFRTYMIPDYSLSTSESSVAVASPTLTANGTSQTTVTVTSKDAQGTPMTTGGASVAINATSGTVGPVTDNGNGTYTAILTAPTVAGASTISATMGGTPIGSTTNVMFVPGAPSLTTSTLAATTGTLIANGSSTTSIVVTLKDAYGNKLNSGGASVAINATAGTVGNVTDNGNGTYTAVLTAPTTVGTSNVSATVGGSTIASTASVQFVAGVPSSTTSTLTLGSSSLLADGTSQTTATMSLKDASGNAIKGDTVTMTSTLGTIGAVTNNGDGSYTATLTAPTLAGTSTITATVSSNSLTKTAAMQFVPGAPSTAVSTITVGSSTLTADGTSQTIVTVTLKDANSNMITSGGASVAIAASSGTISAVTDNGNGTYTATLTAPTAVGTSIISAKVGGNAMASTTSVQFIAGAPSGISSTITVGSSTLTATGTSQTDVTVTLKDAQGNVVTTVGPSVSITATKGTIGAVTYNGNGTYTATLTSATAVGTSIISAAVNGSAIAATANVQFTAGAPSGATSTVVVGSSTLTADGTSQTVVTVTLQDAHGNAIATGGASVAINATKGTVSAVMDNGDGTYTATLTAPTTVGTSTVSATIAGNAIASTASVQLVPGAPSTAVSAVAVGNGTLTADGTSQTTVTVTLKDTHGNAITIGGSSITIAATKGTISAVTDNGDGTYTATLTAPTSVGTSTVSAKISGSDIASTASVQFVPGALSGAASTISVSNSALTANGTSQALVTVTLQDAYGNAMTTGGASVAITATKGTVSAVIDNGNGTYTATLTAPTTVGTSTIGATVAGSAIATAVSVQFVPGAPSIATSTVSVGNAAITADGTSQTVVTVTLLDAQGNAITIGGASVAITATKGTISAVTDQGDGTYTATLTAPTSVGTAAINAKIGGSAIASTASIQFVPGASSATTSTVIVDNGTLTADGTGQATVTVTLKDGQGNAITTGGASVSIATTKGTISTVMDQGDGTYTAVLTAPTTVGIAIVSASVGGNVIGSTASVQFIPGAPSTAISTVAADSSTLTADGTSQTTVTVSLIDAHGNPIANGGESVAITATKGTVSAVTDKGDGTYTATLTAPTTVGTSTISAKIGSSAIAATSSVQFVPGAPSTAASMVALDDNALTADGTSQTTITVTLKDAHGNAITNGGATVSIAATTGAVSTVAEQGNGVYTATLTAPTTVGTSTISSMINGGAIASTASIQFVPGASSAATSTVTVNDNTLTADGTSQTTVTVTLKDAHGNAITNGGSSVAIIATKGSISTVTDKGNGTYTAKLTAPTTTGESTVSATVGSVAIVSTAKVQFVPDAASTATSTVIVGNGTLTADGTSQTTVTVALKDAQGNALTNGGATVAITAAKGTISAVTDNGDGTYTATLTAPTVVGTSKISAKIGSNVITSTASVQFTPGAPAAATSTVAVDHSTLTADGTSQATVTVALKDAYGNAITTGGSSVTIASTKGTVGVVTDQGNGTYTAELTTPTTVGNATITASVGGSAIASTASVQFVPGASSAATSTVTVNDNTLTADGTSQTTVTVSLIDAHGNPIANGGESVAITATKGTVSAVTDKGDGTYTATLTAPTTAGTSTISAKIGSSAIAATASVQFVPGAPSTAASMVALDDNALTADGTSQTTITVTLKDAHGNAITNGGATVSVAATTGTVSTVADQGNGVYTATLTAPTTVGTSTISSMINGGAIASTASVQFVPGAPSTATSTVAVDDSTLTADGTSQAIVTVTLKDAYGNSIASGGATVAITASNGSIGTITDKGNGTYTAALTAPTTVGTSIISATVDGSLITSTASVNFVPGAASTATSKVTVGNGTLTADGTSQTTVTVALKDAQGNALTNGGATIAITATKGAVSAVTDNGDGTYTATLTSPIVVGTSKISAKIGSSVITSTASVQFTPGAPAAATSTVAVDHSTLTADGTSQATVTVTLKDAHGNAITNGGASVEIAATTGTVSAITDQGDGTYTATLTASTTAGSSNISAKINGSAIASTVNVQFVPGSPSTATSMVTVDHNSLTADGTSSTTVTIALKDAHGNAITDGGQSVTITAAKGTVGTVMDHNDGTYTATVTAPTTVGTSTISAKIDNSAIASTTSVHFVPGAPAAVTSTVSVGHSTLKADGTSSTTVTVTLKDAYGNAINSGGASVTITATGGTISAVTDHNDGTYTATLTAPTTVGTSKISAVVGSKAIASTASVQFMPGAASATNSKITADHHALTANGISKTTITVTLKDGQDNAITSGGETVAVSASIGTIGAVTDHGDGTYSAVLTAPGFSGTATITAQVNGTTLASTLEVSFTTEVVNDPLAITINGSQVFGVVSSHTNPNGEKFMEIRPDANMLTKPLSGTKDKIVTVTVPYEADSYSLMLPGKAVVMFADQSASITFVTKLGQYRLPLHEIISQGSNWSDGDDISITIKAGQVNEMTGLQDAADQSGLQLIGQPLHFQVQVLHQGESKDITGYNGYVERIMFLPTNAGAASTVMVWDENGKLRPVPTMFIEADGRQAAVIHSITNSVYVLVSKTSGLNDIKEHWATNEIADMNRRVIINGVDGSRFAPEASITRAELAALLARALGLPEAEQSAGFRDVSDSSWYGGYVAAVKAYGLMDGYEDGTFKPNKQITRQEAIVTIVRAMQLITGLTGSGTAGAQADFSVYSDNAQVGAWARDAIQTALDEGLMKGYGDALYPNKSLTRAETAVLLYRMLQKVGFINE